MFGSLKLGRLFGIDLYAHGTFWLLPLMVVFGGVFSGGVFDTAYQLAFLFAVFGCVVLHEVGHALAGRYFGVDTTDITLYPIGGVARLERMPERPVQEIVIALAGPAVNLVIAVGLLAGLVGSHMLLPGAISADEADPVKLFAEQLLGVNLFLLLFNLIPAFPMDGGRVLRAALSIGMPRLSATRIAATVSAILAAAGVFVGVFGSETLGIPAGHLSLILVSGVVFLLGQAELAAVRMQAARKRWREMYQPPDDDEPDVRVGAVRSNGPFTGWTWDAHRRLWTEWRNGTPIREVPPA